MQLTLPGPYKDNVQLPVGAQTVNQLLREAVRLDQTSYRRNPAFDSAADLNVGAPEHYPAGAETFRTWWGTILYKPGMTTLTVKGIMDKRGSAYMAIYVNGVQKDTQTTNGTFTKSIAIDSGLADGAPIAIDVFVHSNSSSGGTYLISDAYANVPSVATAYPGKPLFGPTYFSAAFDQLNQCMQHVAERITMVPRVAQIGHHWSLGAMATVLQRPVYTGFVTRNYTSDILRIYGSTLVRTPSERMRVYINGSNVYNTDPWTPGTYTVSLAFALTGTAIGDAARVDIASEVLTPGPKPWAWSRNTFQYIGSEADMYGYPVPTIPDELDPLGSYTQADLTARLNAIATIVDDTKTRLDTVACWGRVRAMRRMFCHRDDQTNWYKRFAPRLNRLGDKLTVRGKNVQLGWGPLVLENPLTEAFDYTPTYTQQITDNADEIQTKTVFLNEQKGLGVGSPYVLLGEVHYAAEE